MIGQEVRISVPASDGCISAVRSFFRVFIDNCPELPFDAAEVKRLELALHESLANSVRHARVRTGTGDVELKINVEHDRLKLKVRDEGEGFELGDIPEPEPDDLPECGFGLYIIRKTMDLVETERIDGGFVLSMTRYFEPASRMAGGQAT
jgi:anti-sigma regulatory factor (Ser/Thr protein kinase)